MTAILLGIQGEPMAEWAVPVRLAYATTQDHLTMMRVKVKHFAVEERVRVRCRHGPGWDDFDLPRTAQHTGYDVFSGTVPSSDEFAISYSADGVDYWDNNDLHNYRVPMWSNAIGGRVCLRRARLAITDTNRRWMRGEIYVDNTSYGKNVGIRMLPDGASRWRELAGIYDGIAREGDGAPWVEGPVERWKFTSPAFDSRDCSFAAYYHELDSGKMFWDNNFGQGYRFGGDSALD
jgi:hypothetical protein